ncbi:hypothetical protein TNCV_184111 [Trichonephila clavipes]|nr:hypothetical protein TNCV_184111 [Trichonephila clavipes]
MKKCCARICPLDIDIRVSYGSQAQRLTWDKQASFNFSRRLDQVHEPKSPQEIVHQKRTGIDVLLSSPCTKQKMIWSCLYQIAFSTTPPLVNFLAGLKKKASNVSTCKLLIVVWTTLSALMERAPPPGPARPIVYQVTPSLAKGQLCHCQRDQCEMESIGSKSHVAGKVL